MEKIHLWIGFAQQCHAFYICLVIGFSLVLIDYLFPVDWPAYLGYFMFGLACFFGTSHDITRSTFWFFGVFFGLLIAHKFIFSRFLTNAKHLETGEYS